jgi:hypothetical protein
MRFLPYPKPRLTTAVVLFTLLGSLSSRVVRALPTEPPTPEVTPQAAPPQPSPPPAVLIESHARASDDYMVKPIFVTATVRNNGKETIDRIVVQLTLSPNTHDFGHRRYIPTPDQDRSPFEPVVQVQSVEHLYPGSTRAVDFQTPYYASSGFSRSGGFFEVENLAPNMRFSAIIQYKVELFDDEQNLLK